MRSIPLIAALLLAGCAAEEQGPLWTGWPLGQRSKMPFPGLRGEVWVSIGDIRNGATATVRVSDRSGKVLADEYDTRWEDSVRFEYMSEHYEVTVLRYEDDLIMDQAYLQFRHLPKDQD